MVSVGFDSPRGHQVTPTMVTAKQTEEKVAKIEDQDIVDTAWSADRGVVVALLDRADTHGSIFQLIDLAEYLDMDGSIEIEKGWRHEGENRDAVILEHQDRQ